METYEKYKPSGIDWIGEVPEHWDVMPLKHGADVIMGQSPSGEDIKDEGVTPFMQGNAEFGSKYPHSSYYCDNCSKHSRVGDILMSVRAPVGELNISDQVYGIGRGLCSIKSEKFDQGFLWFYLQKSKDDFNALANGSTFTAITVDTLNNYPILLPPLAEQEAIAAYLDARCADIDKVVATQQRRIVLLQELKQSEITQAVTRGLNPDARMKDSDVEWIGMVPEDWEKMAMKYFFYMKGRIGWQGLKADEFIDEGPYLITGTDFENGRVVWDRCYHISQERYDQDPAIHVQIGDLLITKDGTVGKLALIDSMPDIASLNSHLLILRPYDKNKIRNEFVYWYLSSQIFKTYTGLTQSGSIMESLSQEKIGGFVMAVPDVDEQIAIVEYLEKRCGEIDKQIGAVTKQIELLREYKQALITEVVTGKRKV
jgi:type I restriction enzyme S subunit